MKSVIVIFGMLTVLAQIPVLGQQSPHDQELVSAEYFVNKDPGEGYGIPIALSKSLKQINISTILTPQMSSGNVVYFRVKSSNGKWSGANGVTFRYKPMRTAEYFVRRAQKGDKSNAGSMKIQAQEEPSPFFTALSDTSLKLSPEDTVFVRFQTTEYFWGDWLKYVVPKTK